MKYVILAIGVMLIAVNAGMRIYVRAPVSVSRRYVTKYLDKYEDYY